KRVNDSFVESREKAYEEEIARGDEDVPDAPTTTPEALAALMAASSCVSADAPVAGGGAFERTPISRAARLAAPEEGNPDRLVEEGEALGAMRRAYSNLTILERKLLA